MELGLRNYGIAETAFIALPKSVQNRMFSLISDHLKTKITNFSEFIEAYKQENQKLKSNFQGMLRSSSIQGIVYSASEFDDRIKLLGFLLSTTNKIIADTLVEVYEALKTFTHDKNYEEKTKSTRTALTGLERVLSFGADNRTTLWAEQFSKIAQHWIDIIKYEVTKLAQDISPIISIDLVEEYLSYNLEKKLRAIFRVNNLGAGTADSINL